MAGSKKLYSRRIALACPYFMPVTKLEGGSWPHPARLPLGYGWSGHCTAPGHEKQTPSRGALESFCNLGYAGGCTWAPLERRWDAVRFAVCAPDPGPEKLKHAGDVAARILCLRYICERDHRPVSDGELRFDVTAGAWLNPHEDSRIQKMAECFLEAYLKKKTFTAEHAEIAEKKRD